MKQTLFPLSLLVALLFVGIGCDRRPFKDDPAFDDKVLILENNPELLLVRMTKDFLADTFGISRTSLRSEKAILDAAKEHHIEFEGLD